MFTSSLSTLYSNLYKKQEQLQRLNMISLKLEHSYNEFASYLNSCMEPALSSDTWHGKIARSFDDFREVEIQDSYRTILTAQFPLQFAVLENKIQDLQNDIDDLYKAIARAEEAARERAKNK